MTTSEKFIEKKLGEQVKKLGGWSLKLVPTFVTGLPDRLCLLPGGRIFFAELKSTGKKPRASQFVVIEKIRQLGFEVYVIDRVEQINEIIEKYK